ncbi:TetR/AcrR family transcriptional regulator [Actinacidiphila glaucinigra]|uniref:TetR/AcrR family transcriptional regulator n=1 Tax=Actinacidiphila glaucinigra TaxID=235986 RepID=UPI003670B4F1
MDRVTAEADVARGTFYRHFEGKDDLVRAYLERQRIARSRGGSARPRTSSFRLPTSLPPWRTASARRSAARSSGAVRSSTPRPSARTARALSIRRCCDTTPGSAGPCRQMSSPSYRWEVPPPPGGRAPWFPQLAPGGAPRCGASQGGESSS